MSAQESFSDRVPPEGQIVDRAALQASIDRAGARERCGFRRDVRFFDFEANGKPFTQAAILFVPEKPLRVDGRRVVLIASEGGSDNGRAFVRDNEGRDGIGPWLASRGVTFMTLCRIGRWNFLSDEELGSWRDVPLGARMPVFWRGQKQHWSPDTFDTIGAEGVSSPTGSTACRVPRKGSALEAHMLALTPDASMQGFEAALRNTPELGDASDRLLLYWGFSTGGCYLWALARRVAPDGLLGYGTTSLPVAYFASRAVTDDFKWLYDPSAFRVRERGANDFAFFNAGLPAQERDRLWQEVLHAPRFKSHEDTLMFFNVAALSETIARLWNADFLPDDVRCRGFADLLKTNLDLCFPGEHLRNVSVLELFGADDEILPPQTARLAADVMRPYTKRFRQAFLPGLHHSVAADHAQAFGSVWLDAIEAGWFSKN